MPGPEQVQKDFQSAAHVMASMIFNLDPLMQAFFNAALLLIARREAQQKQATSATITPFSQKPTPFK